MKKIYISIIVVVIAIVGVIYYTNQQNKQIDKEATRPVYPVEKKAIYNGLLLANSKGNPNRYDTYLYFPNQKQLLDNIPKCVEPVKADATEYLKAYKKVYKYILKEKLISKYRKKEIGKYAKWVLDFNYNYHTFPYFRDMYNNIEVQYFFKSKYNIGGTKFQDLFKAYLDRANGTGIAYMQGTSLEDVVNANFSKSEQEELAKAQGRLLKQVSENCVQAGYGKDFYSIWWAGLANQGVLGITSQSDMMYDVFWHSYFFIMTEANSSMFGIRNSVTRAVEEKQAIKTFHLKGKIWQILFKHKPFIDKVRNEAITDDKAMKLILNTLTAEILQDDFKNMNYSLPLRVALLRKLITEVKYKNNYSVAYNYLTKNLNNKEYFIIQNFSSWIVNSKQINEKTYKEKCLKVKRSLSFSSRKTRLRTLSDLGYFTVAWSCGSSYIDSGRYKQLKKFFV